jgi:hypothetical protein
MVLTGLLVTVQYINHSNIQIKSVQFFVGILVRNTRRQKKVKKKEKNCIPNIHLGESI